MRTLFALPILPALLLISSPAAANECLAGWQAGTIKTHAALGECVNRIEAGMYPAHNQDLAKFLGMRRVAIFREVDRKKISLEEAVARIQAVVVDVQTEVQKRAANAQASQSQAQQAPQPASRGVTFCNTLGASTICF